MQDFVEADILDAKSLLYAYAPIVAVLFAQVTCEIYFSFIILKLTAA